MKLINKILKIIDLINEKIAKIASFAVFLLILALTYEVVARYGFNRPTQWSFDATYFLASFVLVLALGYTWQEGEHVAVDLISERLPRRVTAFLNVIFLLGLFFLCWGNILRILVPHLQRSWMLRERAMIGFMPPVYPYKTWIFVGILLMFLQGVAEFIREMVVLIKGGERP